MGQAPDNIIPLEIPPGFLKTTTPNAGKGRYTGGDKVRFVGGFPEKWKGWVKYIEDQLTGIARGATAWTNQYGNNNVAIGTHLKLYAITGDDTLVDITPIRASSTIGTDPFAVTDGSATVTVTDVAHGAVATDFVTFSGAEEVGGLDLNGEYQIVEKIDNDTYTITAASAAALDTYRKVLLHFQGADASTTITDDNTGGSAHTWSVAGNAQIDTAQFKFGTASLLLDGTGDWVTVADHADFALGAGAFTIDLQFRCNKAGGTLAYLAGQCDSSATVSTMSFIIGRTAANFIEATVAVGAVAFTVTGTTQFTDAVNTGWHHVELVRTGDILKLFIDGVQEGGNVAITGTVNNATNALRVGAAGEVTTTPWIGWIDEFSLSVGIARHTTTFTPPTSAYASDTPNGGAAVTAAYNITSGTVGTVYGLGWGAGTWSGGTWSTPRVSGIPIEGRFWSTIEYGNDLLASPSGGGLYLWQEATDARAEVVSGAPTAIRAMFLTGERFIFALGTTTGMTVQWPDVDDITDWTPSAANTANTRTLQSGSKLMNGCPLLGGTNLVWSDTSLYVFQKVESDFIYDSRLAGSNCGLIGPDAFDTVSGACFWMSAKQCFMYSQGIQLIPNFENVRAYVLDDMDATATAKIWGFHDQANNQMRWGYCSIGSQEPDKYFDVSLDGQYNWTTGTLDRTTAALHRPSQGGCVMVDHDSYVYVHDSGLDADDAVLESYISFGQYALTRGQVNVDIASLITDTERQVGQLTYELYTKDYPDDEFTLEEKTITINPHDATGEVRLAGRHFGMTVRSNEMGGDYRLGIPSLELGEAGER